VDDNHLALKFDCGRCTGWCRENWMPTKVISQEHAM